MAHHSLKYLFRKLCNHVNKPWINAVLLNDACKVFAIGKTDNANKLIKFHTIMLPFYYTISCRYSSSQMYCDLISLQTLYYGHDFEYTFFLYILISSIYRTQKLRTSALEKKQLNKVKFDKNNKLNLKKKKSSDTGLGMKAMQTYTFIRLLPEIIPPTLV
jgi:hypothetical protein